MHFLQLPSSCYKGNTQLPKVVCHRPPPQHPSLKIGLIGQGQAHPTAKTIFEHRTTFREGSIWIPRFPSNTCRFSMLSARNNTSTFLNFPGQIRQLLQNANGWPGAGFCAGWGPEHSNSLMASSSKPLVQSSTTKGTPVGLTSSIHRCLHIEIIIYVYIYIYIYLYHICVYTYLFDPERSAPYLPTCFTPSPSLSGWRFARDMHAADIVSVWQL